MPAKKASKASTKKAPKKSAKTSAKKAAGGDWRVAVLERARKLIREADPAIVEEAKWRKPSNPAGVPAWSRDGLICTGETYKDHVKLTFFRGGDLEDPAGLFNTGFGGVRRAIDLKEGDTLDAAAFKGLVRAAVALNQADS